MAERFDADSVCKALLVFKNTARCQPLHATTDWPSDLLPGAACRYSNPIFKD